MNPRRLYDRTHVLAAGGGRELAYVAMSRAREHTIVHVTADDVAQAVADLRADWGASHQQRWIADTPAQPGGEPGPSRAASRAATHEPAPPVVPIRERLDEARRHLADLERDYRDLHAGGGRWRPTPEGQVARTRHDSLQRLEEARRVARHPNAGRRDRRAATKAIPALEAAGADAELRWHSIAEPTAVRLRSTIRTAREQIDRLESQALTERLDRLQHPPSARTIDRDLGISL